MSVLPALLSGLAVAVAVGLPPDGAGRLGELLPRGDRAGHHDLPPTARAGGPSAPGPSRTARWGSPAHVGRAVARLRVGWTRALPLLIGIAALLSAGPAPALAAGALALAAVLGLQGRARASEQRQERAGALEACAVLAGELRAGRAPGAALQAAALVARGPFQGRLQAATAAARFGGDPALPLRTATPVGPTAVPEVASSLAACWSVCSATGTGLAAAVDRLEEGLRGAAAARQAVEAELAGPRATAGLLALLPLAGVALAAALGARPVHVLLHTSVGGVCLVLGVALDLAGLAWTRRIARGAGGT